MREETCIHIKLDAFYGWIDMIYFYSGDFHSKAYKLQEKLSETCRKEKNVGLTKMQAIAAVTCNNLHHIS